MNSTEFVNKAKNIAKNYKTLYVLGCFGSPMNAANKKRYTSNNAYNKNRAKIINAASSDTFGFDCVCLIKGILWGWNGNTNATYGGAVYNANNVPDVGADQMMNYCTGVSTNFSNIQPGEVVHMPGHIGIYIGDGLAVECTPAWKNKVQITAVGNIGKKAGYNTRTWTNHGKLKWITYNNSNNNGSNTKPTNKQVNVWAQVKTVRDGWLPEVKNNQDYCGWKNSPITDMKIRVDKGSIKYSFHKTKQGYIDTVQVYYYTPKDIRPYKKAKYKVNNYDWQYDTEAGKDPNGNIQDGYAGKIGVNMTEFRIEIV